MIPVRVRMSMFWAAVVFAFVMAVIPHPPELPGHPSDKLQHMAAFATLALLGAWAYAEVSLLWLLWALSLYGAGIELVQAIPALGRDCDFRDWIADTLAAGLVLLLVHWWRSRRRRRAADA